MNKNKPSCTGHIPRTLKCLFLSLKSLPFLFFLGCAAGAAAAAGVLIEEYAPGDDSIRFSYPTHIAFHGEMEIITDLRNHRFVYRSGPDSEFEVSPVRVKGPHSVLFNPIDGLYYANDTDNSRMIAFRDIAKAELTAAADTMAGIKLSRPHDQVLDKDSGWMYMINPTDPAVIRFRALGVEESSLDLSEHLRYSRSLTFADGKLHVVGSSSGRVVVIHDFELGEYDVHTSWGKKRSAPAGNWGRTGLVLNDIALYDGWWYASSYFSPAHSQPGEDYDKNKLIRFRSWDDFTSGNWEDLSELLPAEIVPYYFTVHRESMFLGAFYHAGRRPEGREDVVFRIFSAE